MRSKKDDILTLTEAARLLSATIRAHSVNGLIRCITPELQIVFQKVAKTLARETISLKKRGVLFEQQPGDRLSATPAQLLQADLFPGEQRRIAGRNINNSANIYRLAINRRCRFLKRLELGLPADSEKLCSVFTLLVILFTIVDSTKNEIVV